MSIFVLDRLMSELLDNLKFLCSFETGTHYEKKIKEAEIIYYTNEVQELNKKYGLNLKCIEDYEYSPSHFLNGSWFISDQGYFVRYHTY